MVKVSKTALVAYSAAELFDIVRDVEKYPLFLPWCASTEILSDSDKEMQATMTIARAGMSHSLTTINRFETSKSITMDLLDGPFDHLSGRWQFIHFAEQASKVMFDIEFQVKAKFLGVALSAVFSQAADTMVTSFEKRAVEIYGKR